MALNVEARFVVKLVGPSHPKEGGRKASQDEGREEKGTEVPGARGLVISLPDQ